MRALVELCGCIVVLHSQALLDAEDLVSVMRRRRSPLARGAGRWRHQTFGRANGGFRLRLCANSFGKRLQGVAVIATARRQRELQLHAAPARRALRPYALISAISVAAPRILITRRRLYANTCRLISVRTLGSVLVRK